MTNFIEIKKFNPFRKYFLYMDTHDFDADLFLLKREVNVKFLGEYEKPGDPYLVVFCSVKNNDVLNFYEAMLDLRDKMEIFERSYEEECKKFFVKLRRDARSIVRR